ncbi:MAG: hypothetical protein QOJ61_2888, partial [Mycobacterium sp.]|nr:hypothetical protein [Mycobacterium sp.]
SSSAQPQGVACDLRRSEAGPAVRDAVKIPAVATGVKRSRVVLRDAVRSV